MRSSPSISTQPKSSSNPLISEKPFVIPYRLALETQIHSSLVQDTRFEGLKLGLEVDKGAVETGNHGSRRTPKDGPEEEADGVVRNEWRKHLALKILAMIFFYCLYIYVQIPRPILF